MTRPYRQIICIKTLGPSDPEASSHPVSHSAPIFCSSSAEELDLDIPTLLEAQSLLVDFLIDPNHLTKMPSKLNIFSKSSSSKSSNGTTNFSRLHEPRGSTESSTPLNESFNLAQEKQKSREAMRQRQAEEFLAKQGYVSLPSTPQG